MKIFQIRSNFRGRFFVVFLLLLFLRGINAFPIKAQVITSYQQTLEKVADPSTNHDGFLPQNARVEDNGRIWTDKTVGAEQMTVYDASGKQADAITAPASEFLVSLSALAQAETATNQVVAPSDTVFIIDLSTSMYMNKLEDNTTSYVKAMVEALNEAIGMLLAANPNNRVGVVAFGGASGASKTYQVLKLDRYDEVSDGQYFHLRGLAYVEVSPQIPAGKILIVPDPLHPENDRAIRVQGGTPTQRGILAGAQMLLAVPAADTIYQTSPFELIRKPNLVLMTDGEPSLGWSDYRFSDTTTSDGDPISDSDDGFDSGNANYSDMGIDILTVLTAAYFKEKVRQHYYSDPQSTGSRTVGFYTIGLGVSGNQDANATLDPMGEAGNNLFNVDLLSQSSSGTTYKMRSILDNFLTNGSTTFPSLIKDSSSKRSLINVNNNPDSDGIAISSYDYADRYVAADSVADLKSAFAGVAQQIITTGNYVTAVVPNPSGGMSAGSVDYGDYSGMVVFSDVLGEQMEFKEALGIWLDGKKHTGESFAQNASSIIADPTANNSQQFLSSFYARQGFLRSASAPMISPADVTAILANSLLAGTNDGLYHVSSNDYHNGVRYYCDATGVFTEQYFDASGIKRAPTNPNTVAFADHYVIQGVTTNPTNANDNSDLTFAFFEVITAITDDVTFHDYNFSIDASNTVNAYEITQRKLQQNQQLVRWYIPASLLPLRTVLPQGSGSNATHLYVNNTAPIQLIYTVGLKTDYSLSDLSNSYQNNSSYRPSGQDAYYFYTNAWDDANASLAHFIPAANNSYYDTAPTTANLAKTANPTQTKPQVMTSDSATNQGISVHRQFLGNNGRLKIPYTTLRVNKGWDTNLTLDYWTSGGDESQNLIKNEWVQLYSNGQALGQPLELVPNELHPQVSPTADPDPTGNNSWTQLPLYQANPGGQGEAVPIEYEVKEGTWDSGTQTFTPYDDTKTDFIVVHNQPRWNTQTLAWDDAHLYNHSRYDYEWLINLNKNFTGLDPLKTFDSNPEAIEYLFFGSVDGVNFAPLTVADNNDGKIFYPRDFINGKLIYPIFAQASVIEIGGVPVSKMHIKVVEKNHAVPDFTWNSLSWNGSAQTPASSEIDIDASGGADVFPGDYVIDLPSIGNGETIDVNLTNAYSQIEAKFTLTKSFTNGIDLTDEHDITFVVEGWESKSAFEAALAKGQVATGNKSVAGRVFYDTTHCHLIKASGSDGLEFPIADSEESAWANDPANIALYPHYQPIDHPDSLPPGYYTITEKNADQINKPDPLAPANVHLHDVEDLTVQVNNGSVAADKYSLPNDTARVVGFPLAAAESLSVDLTNSYRRRQRLVIRKDFAGDVSNQIKEEIDFTIAEASNPTKILRHISYRDFNNGKYIINDLEPGDYVVAEHHGAMPAGYEFVANLANPSANAANIAYNTADAVVEFTNAYRRTTSHPTPPPTPPTIGGGDNPPASAKTCTAGKPAGPAPYIYQATATDKPDSITLHFQVGGEPFTKYLVEYGYRDGDFAFGAIVDNPKAGNFTINDLTPGKAYQFRLIPVNDCAGGEPSNTYPVTVNGLPKVPGVPNTGG